MEYSNVIQIDLMHLLHALCEMLGNFGVISNLRRVPFSCLHRVFGTFAGLPDYVGGVFCVRMLSRSGYACEMGVFYDLRLYIIQTHIWIPADNAI